MTDLTFIGADDKARLVVVDYQGKLTIYDLIDKTTLVEDLTSKIGNGYRALLYD